MKKILKLSMLSLLAVGLTTSCSKDWLEESPTGSTSTSTIFENTTYAYQAVRGLSRLMKTQYLSSQGFNGEGTIKLYYGNYQGNHFTAYLTGWVNTMTMGYLKSNSSSYDYYPWYYYYKIVGNANTILANIDQAEETNKGERAHIKAQALVFRAYCFLMLSQLYCYRWVDYPTGDTNGIVLRTDTSSGDYPLSTLAETYQQIYDDLDEAISCFEECGITRDAMNENYLTDINVAYAVYARAAITRQDYETAITMARKAREGYPLMSGEEFCSGFNTPNSEWIWSVHDQTDEEIYYYSFGAYIGYNANTSHMRSYPKMVSKELFDKMDLNDVRRSLFLDPSEYTDWNSTTSGAATTNGDMFNAVHEKYPEMPSDSKVYAYMNFKFKVTGGIGVMHMNLFRSAEMYLIEAEAMYMENQSASSIQALLEELVRDSGRNPEYTCTATGEELLEEIKFQKAVEFWGEGHDWFDLKRWGDSMSRKSWANGGNFYAAAAVTRDPSAENHWTWVLPERETNYNALIGANATDLSEE